MINRLNLVYDYRTKDTNCKSLRKRETLLLVSDSAVQYTFALEREKGVLNVVSH